MLRRVLLALLLQNLSSFVEPSLYVPIFDDIPAIPLHQSCLVDLNASTSRPQPLFLEPESDLFVEPLPNGVLQLEFGDAIEIVCPEGFDEPFDGTHVLAECFQGEYFIVDGQSYHSTDFRCKNEVVSVARRTKHSCGGAVDATLVEVGFEAGDRFLTLFEVCHDEDLEATLYVHHELTPSSVGYQRSVPRPQFGTGDFYNGKDVNFLYTKKQQKKTFATILGRDVEQYFNDSYSIYIARGHLAAKTDVIYETHQMATFYFINAAPQWQRFNAGNWERVEDGVRRFVADRNIYVECFTGTYGIMKLPDANGHPRELFLSIDRNGDGQIPVPMLYFRVVYNPESKLAIVLIGVNNPHLTYEGVAEEYIICDDVSDEISWIKWKKDDIPLGYSYACEFNDFSKTVDYVPKLDVVGLLV